MAVAAWARPEDLPRLQPAQAMVIYGVSWKDDVILREVLGKPSLRMTYCEGVLELMSPSRERELWKKSAARLIETYRCRSSPTRSADE